MFFQEYKVFVSFKIAMVAALIVYSGLCTQHMIGPAGFSKKKKGQGQFQVI